MSTPRHPGPKNAPSAWLTALPLVEGGLRLRLLRESDLPAFLGYRSDPEVARFQGWAPMDADAARAYLRAQADSAPHAARTWRQVGIADATDDRLLGDLGIWLFPHAREAELGISLARAEQGRGAGRRAVGAVCALLFMHADVVRIRAAVDVRNLPSLRMLTAAGFLPYGARSVVCKGETCEEQLLARVRGDGPACDTAHPGRSTGAAS